MRDNLSESIRKRNQSFRRSRPSKPNRNEEADDGPFGALKAQTIAPLWDVVNRAAARLNKPSKIPCSATPRLLAHERREDGAMSDVNEILHISRIRVMTRALRRVKREHQEGLRPVIDALEKLEPGERLIIERMASLAEGNLPPKGTPS
jgi:hypothetical protein